MRVITLFIGVAAALVLLSLMVLTRLLSPDLEQAADVTLHRVEWVELSPPPPPPPEPEQPEDQDVPPPPAPALQNLLPSSDPDAPKMASTDQPLPIDMGFEDFALDVAVADLPVAPKPVAKPQRSRPSRGRPASPKRSSFSMGELDSRPRILSHPMVRYPSSLARKGIRSGKAVVVVKISPSGKTSLVRIVSLAHPELKAAATRIANGSRFTPPKKDGKAVTAVMTWPLIIR